MPYTQEQLAALEDAIAQGVTSVKYQDKEVHYLSLSDLIKLRDIIKRELGLLPASTVRIYAKFNKGL